MIAAFNSFGNDGNRASCDEGVGCGLDNGIAVITRVIPRIALFYDDGSQTTASIQKPIADAGDILRNRDGLQIQTTPKHSIAERCDTGWNLNGFQTVTVKKGIIPNLPYILGDDNRFQFQAFSECADFDTGDNRKVL